MITGSRGTHGSQDTTVLPRGCLHTIEKVQECIQVVSASMPRMGYRTHRSYATVLAFSLIVINFNFSTNTPFLPFTLVYIVYLISCMAENSGVVTCDEVSQFTTSVWIPEVLRIYHPSSNVIAEYFTGLLAKIQHLEVFEVHCE